MSRLQGICLECHLVFQSVAKAAVGTVQDVLDWNSSFIGALSGNITLADSYFTLYSKISHVWAIQEYFRATITSHYKDGEVEGGIVIETVGHHLIYPVQSIP